MSASVDRTAHILVIEDAPDVLDMLSMLLRLEGAHVVGAATGREALAISRARRFDVVVSDLGLPDIPGDVLIRGIIAAGPGPIEIVVITGERGPSVSRALEAGARKVFTKPCEWGQVISYLNGLDRMVAPEVSWTVLDQGPMARPRPVAENLLEKRQHHE